MNRYGLSFLQHLYVHRAELFRIFGICFRFKRNVLPFSQSLIAFHRNRREMYEHVVATLFICKEAIALFCVEPFDCTLCHFSSTPLKFHTESLAKTALLI